jgi:hypothetical protein
MLCELCARICAVKFDEPTKYEKVPVRNWHRPSKHLSERYFRYHDDISSLKGAAAAGCEICHHVLVTCSDHSLEVLEQSSSSTKRAMYVILEDFRSCFWVRDRFIFVVVYGTRLDVDVVYGRDLCLDFTHKRRKHALGLGLDSSESQSIDAE